MNCNLRHRDVEACIDDHAYYLGTMDMWEQIEEVCPDAPGAVFDKDVCMQLVDDVRGGAVQTRMLK